MVVLLRLLAGLEFAEIAKATGQGLSAAKMRYARALEKLGAAASSCDGSTQRVVIERYRRGGQDFCAG